jgi:serine phosphatase RsbU (regulator of sigma subunit)
VIDAQNPAGESFSKERLLKLLVAKHASAEALVNGIQKQINQHIHGIELYDDITIWALRRN